MTDNRHFSSFAEWLAGLPRGLFSILTVLLILWLTLSPDPLGKDSPRLFPGADKVAHALMFGFLTTMTLLDHTRRLAWSPVSIRFISATVAGVTIFGCLIEVAQLEMNIGRGFEYTDMLADFIGAALCGAGWSVIINPLLRHHPLNNDHDERSR